MKYLLFVVLISLPFIGFGQIEKNLNVNEIYYKCCWDWETKKFGKDKKVGKPDEDYIHYSTIDHLPVTGFLEEVFEQTKYVLYLQNGVYQWVKVYENGVLIEKIVYEREYDGFPHNKIGKYTYYPSGMVKSKKILLCKVVDLSGTESSCPDEYILE